ncbi:MAG: TolC family protein [bacterium]
MNKKLRKIVATPAAVLVLLPFWMAGNGCATQKTEISSSPDLDIEKRTAADTRVDHAGDSLALVDALYIGLHNNRSLSAEKLEIPLAKFSLSEQLAQFDPDIALGISGSTTKADERTTARSYRGEFSTGKTFGDGTDLDIGFSSRQDRLDTGSGRYRSRVELGVDRPLLREGGAAVNTLNVKLAKLDIELSRYQFRGFVENLAAEIEKAYWDYVLAARQLQIHEESLRLSRLQLDETQERIRTGRLAAVDEYAASAEVARQRENLIDARSDLENKRLQLLRLINIPGWQEAKMLEAADTPASPETIPEEPDYYLELASTRRPELNEARLKLERGDLQLIQTKNGLLPRLDFFLTAGRSVYAESFSDSLDELNEDNYDLEAGLRFAFPYGNQARRAAHEKAVLNRRQTKIALKNLEDAVNQDVRTAHLEVRRSLAQIEATRSTRRQREEALRAEREKFRVGRSTSFQVAQAQRNLTDSKISEIQARIFHRKAIVELYRLSGSLLENWQIELQM